MKPLRLKFNPAAGWIIVLHDAPELCKAHDGTSVLVPPGLGDIFQRFYGADVQVIENEKAPA